MSAFNPLVRCAIRHWRRLVSTRTTTAGFGSPSFRHCQAAAMVSLSSRTLAARAGCGAKTTSCPPRNVYSQPLRRSSNSCLRCGFWGPPGAPSMIPPSRSTSRATRASTGSRRPGLTLWGSADRCTLSPLSAFLRRLPLAAIPNVAGCYGSRPERAAPRVDNSLGPEMLPPSTVRTYTGKSRLGTAGISADAEVTNP